MWKSLQEYIAAYGSKGFLVLVGLSDVIGVAGLTIAVIYEVPSFNLPVWLWLPCLIFGFLVAPFIPFHRMRTAFTILEARISKADFYLDGAKKLVELRDSGVKTRNVGLQTLDKKGIEKDEVWIDSVIAWKNQVVEVLTTFWPIEAGLFSTANWTKNPAYDMPSFSYVRNSENELYLRIIHYDLFVLTDIIKRHEPETRLLVADIRDVRS